ncbi:MAG: diguanylate cyclase [Acidobacteriota bacterium]|nr:diguanylate cyclase [Acidobacteriota bacterium]
MKFLYLGRERGRAEALNKALSRSQTTISLAGTPEAAFFKVLQEDIQAVFVDLADDSDINGAEVIANLCSLDKQVEIILIAEPGKVNPLGLENLRRCFGFITPNIGEPLNVMVLHQLTYKVSLRHRMDMLKTSAVIDGLTQLYNHAYIQRQLEEDIALLSENGEDLSLVLLDLDNFKHYNDTNGHPAGDKVLRKIAEILDKSVRKIDYAARYGGEEFIMVFPGANLWTCLQVAERVRAAIANTDFEFGHKQPMGFVSASFGAAMLDEQMVTTREMLIQIADQALYKAKRGNRNCIWYYQNGDYHEYTPAGDLEQTL